MKTSLPKTRKELLNIRTAKLMYEIELMEDKLAYEDFDGLVREFYVAMDDIVKIQAVEAKLRGFKNDKSH